MDPGPRARGQSRQGRPSNPPWNLKEQGNVNTRVNIKPKVKSMRPSPSCLGSRSVPLGRPAPTFPVGSDHPATVGIRTRRLLNPHS